MKNKKIKPQDPPTFKVGQLVWDLGTDRLVQILKITEAYGVYRILACYEGETQVRVYKPEELEA